MKTAKELVAYAKHHIDEISIDEVEMHQYSMVIDVRESDEYAKEHLPYAINIPRGLLEFTVRSTPGLNDIETPILMYCKTGGRSALAALTMKEMGYKNIISMKGGFDVWHAAGKPTAK